MATDQNIFSALAAQFPPEEVRWRVGATNKDKTKGLALAYIDARAVMARLDAVVGPANWQDSYQDQGATCVCTLRVRLDGEWIGKSDGAGDSDVEPEKGRISDAFKRAAVKWGVGRYLYEFDSPWEEIDGRAFSKAAHARLDNLVRRTFGAQQHAVQAEPEAHAKAPADTTPEDLADQRTRLVEAFRRWDVTSRDICQHLGVESVSDIEPSQIANMRALYAQINSGAVTAAEVFSRQAEPPAEVKPPARRKNGNGNSNGHKAGPNY
jgi:hypothetical protein